MTESGETRCELVWVQRGNAVAAESGKHGHVPQQPGGLHDDPLHQLFGESVESRSLSAQCDHPHRPACRQHCLCE